MHGSRPGRALPYRVVNLCILKYVLYVWYHDSECSEPWCQWYTGLRGGCVRLPSAHQAYISLTPRLRTLRVVVSLWERIESVSKPDRCIMYKGKFAWGGCIRWRRHPPHALCMYGYVCGFARSHIHSLTYIRHEVGVFVIQTPTPPSLGHQQQPFLFSTTKRASLLGAYRAETCLARWKEGSMILPSFLLCMGLCDAHRTDPSTARRKEGSRILFSFLASLTLSIFLVLVAARNVCLKLQYLNCVEANTA